MVYQHGKQDKLTDVIHAETPGGEEGGTGQARRREAGAGVSSEKDGISYPVLGRGLDEAASSVDRRETERVDSFHLSILIV